MKAETYEKDLSIIIVNWNTRDILKDCLLSVYQNLDKLEAEVFVVDNGSTDSSVEMVKQNFKNVILISNNRNKGFAAANNQAIKLSKGRYVLLLNSDTLVLGNVLTKSIVYMDRNPDVGVMGCRVLNKDYTAQLTCSQEPTLINLILQTSGLWKLSKPKFLGRYKITDWKRNSERDVDVVSGCYMMVRSNAIKEVGILDQSFFFFAEETDWCRRFRKTGWGVRFAPVGEIMHYGGGSSGPLNYRRDVMLTDATVRYHRKHNGLIGEVSARLILTFFNLSRAIYWSLLLLYSKRHKERALHFWQVSIAGLKK